MKVEAHSNSDEPNDNDKKQTAKSSDYQNCPICLSTFDSDAVACLDVCGHKFCLECIQEWSKNINTCPIDRRKYGHIEVRARDSLKLVSRIKVEDRTSVDADDDPVDLTFCEICHLSNREDRMLLCDGCDRGFHCECLSPPIGDIPSGDWYCPRCQQIRDEINHSFALSSHQIEPSSTRQATATTASDSATRVIARTNFAERVRRRVSANRRRQSIASASKSASSSKIRKKRRTFKRKRRRIRRRRILKSSSETITSKRLVSASLKTLAKKKRQMSTLNNRITARKTRTRRRKRRRKVKKRVASKLTLRVNSVRVKRRALNCAKHRIIKKIIKADEVRKMTAPTESASHNNVTADMMSDYICYDIPMTSSAAATSSEHKRPKANQESKLQSTNIVEEILSDIKLLHKKSDEIQVKTDGTLNLMSKHKHVPNLTSTSKKPSIDEQNNLMETSRIVKLENGLKTEPREEHTQVEAKLNTQIASKVPATAASSPHRAVDKSRIKEEECAEFTRERIAEISKQALKPYFLKKLIDKEKYKYIMKKVVTKTESHIQAGSSMSAERIMKLAKAYAEQLSEK